MRLGITELILVLVLVLIFVGPKQIPKLAETIGLSMKSFRHGISESDTSDSEGVTEKANEMLNEQ